WRSVDLEGLLAIIGQPVPFTNQFNARTAVTGALDPLDLGVTATGALQSAAPESREAGSWSINASIHQHALQAQLDLTQAQGNQVVTKIGLAGTKLEKLDGTITLNAADLAALNAIVPSPVRRLALSGQGQGTATLSGS